MRVAVIGTGYVGLVAGACFAESGNDVVCVDKDAAKIRTLEARQDADLRAGPGGAGPPQPARGAADVHHHTCQGGARRPIVFIAVGTPQGEDGSADLQHVLGGGARHRACDERLQGHRRQEHGAGRHRARRSARSIRRRNHAPVQRGQQPRVPEAGGGDRRLHEAGPRGDRRGGSAGAAS